MYAYNHMLCRRPQCLKQSIWTDSLLEISLCQVLSVLQTNITHSTFPDGAKTHQEIKHMRKVDQTKILSVIMGHLYPVHTDCRHRSH